MFLWITIRQTCLGRYIIFHILTTIVQHESKQPLRNKYFCRRIEISVCKGTHPYSYFHLPFKRSYWQFLSKWNFAWRCKYGIFPNIWERNTFQTTNLYVLRFYRQFQRRKLYNWIYFAVILKLRAHNRAGFFNDFELYLKLELFRSSYFGSKSWFYHSPCIGINIRFRGRNLHIFQSPTVKLKLEMWEIGFTVFLSVHEKINFKN